MRKIEHTTLPETPLPKKGWTLTQDVERNSERQNVLIQYWYSFTSLSDASVHASFFKREIARKSRLISSVLFFYILIVTMHLITCLVIPNRLGLWLDEMLVLAAFSALALNRAGKTLSAGLLVVVTFEIAITTILFTHAPLDEASIQIYDLYIITELLAVSLLPIRSIFLVAAIDALLISANFFFQPHALLLARDLQVQLLAILMRPIALQLIVASVASVWAYSTSKAIARADRAEMIATLEHALVEQKSELENGIEQLLQTHVAVANGDLNARAPLNQENALWHIARALNTLLVRLQRASMAEKELQRVEQAVAMSVSSIQQEEQQQQIAHLGITQTAIDPLITALQGKTIASIQLPPDVSNLGFSGQYSILSSQRTKFP